MLLRVLGFAWSKRGLLVLPLVLGLAGLAGFFLSLRLDEGGRRHLVKQFNELRRMPGRLLT